MSAKNKSGILFLGVTLCAICAIATGIMAFAAVKTAEPIRKALEKRTLDGLKIVLPEFDKTAKMSFRSENGRPVEFFRAEKKGIYVGSAAKVSFPGGYGGNVEGLVGLNPDGSIRCFIVTNHNETPGLGTKLTDRKVSKTLAGLFTKKKDDGKLPPNRVLDSFKGHSANDSWKKPWSVKKDGGDCDYESGATITSRAVTALAWEAVSTFKAHRMQIVSGKEQ